jgi:Cu-processing system permease protein
MPWRVVRAIVAFQVRDALRSRWLLAYGAVLAVAGALLLRLGGTGAAALVSMLNVVLLLVPLVTLVLGTAVLYNAREFTELLLAQPVTRRALFIGLTLGHAVPLAGITATGLVLPFVVQRALDRPLLMTLGLFVLVSVLLVGVFSALAFLISTRVADRVRGLSAAILVWLVLSLVYDGVVLYAISALREWPLERPMLVAMLLNPVDLARTTLVLRLDTAALMGYTGAVVQHALGSGVGMAAAIASLLLWIGVPWWIAARHFDQRDF